MAALRFLRLTITASFGFFFFSALYLFYNRSIPARDGLIKHDAALLDADDPGLAFPYDPVPRFDFASVAKYPPHNILEPSKFAYATFYCTRKSDTRGPYFESTQSIIWRLLWSPYRSKYPVIIFVCPFIPEAHRRVFRGQGALVKEIELLDNIIPDGEISTKRWIDVLSKLNMWKETEWNRIVFLDSDAFPITNIDDIFELVPVQQCDRGSLGPEDSALVEKGGKRGEELCNYVYSGVSQFKIDNINAGLLVFKPNLDMHARLIRAAWSKGDYTPHDMEQGVLKSKNAFAADGPFPVSRLPAIWNANTEFYQEYLTRGAEALASEGPLRILHVKMWNRLWGSWNNVTELNDMWDVDWMTMCRFYDSDYGGFIEARKTGVYKTAFERYLETHPVPTPLTTTTP